MQEHFPQINSVKWNKKLWLLVNAKAGLETHPPLLVLPVDCLKLAGLMKLKTLWLHSSFLVNSKQCSKAARRKSCNAWEWVVSLLEQQRQCSSKGFLNKEPLSKWGWVQPELPLVYRHSKLVCSNKLCRLLVEWLVKELVRHSKHLLVQEAWSRLAWVSSYKEPDWLRTLLKLVLLQIWPEESSSFRSWEWEHRRQLVLHSSRLNKMQCKVRL